MQPQLQVATSNLPAPQNHHFGGGKVCVAYFSVTNQIQNRIKIACSGKIVQPTTLAGQGDVKGAQITA